MIIRISPLAYLMILEQRMNDELLRVDIAYVLAAGDERGFSEGWPHLIIRGVSPLVKN